MKRRDAIKKTAFMMGYAVSASAIAGLMSGCQTDTKTPVNAFKGKVFDDTQLATLREAAERILPATDGVVGAKDVMVDRFVDEMMTDAFKQAEVDSFKQGLDDLNAAAKTAHNNTFAALNNEQMDGLITQLMNDGVAARGKEGAPNPFFFRLKEMTFLGFFASEKVGEEVMNYLPIPGGYEGCIPLSSVENQRNWSL